MNNIIGLDNSPHSILTLHYAFQYLSSLRSHNSCSSIQTGYPLETHHWEHQSCPAQTQEYCKPHLHTFHHFLSSTLLTITSPMIDPEYFRYKYYCLFKFCYHFCTFLGKGSLFISFFERRWTCCKTKVLYYKIFHKRI